MDLVKSAKQKILDAGYEIETQQREMGKVWYIHDSKEKITAEYSQSAYTEEMVLLACLIGLAKIDKKIHIDPEEQAKFDEYHAQGKI